MSDGLLLPRDWDDLSPMVDRLLDTSPAERPTVLDELAAGNPERRAELERLLAECERNLPLVERPAVEVFTQLAEEHEGPPLPELLGGRYRIEREVGRGGMARVYLAFDLRHNRRVAVKVIRHEIASSLGHDRFLREIRIAAQLRHPNIMPLYDSGDVDGLLYFVMPYEKGQSLRARLDRDPRMGIAAGVSILRDVARALVCAHEQGVVHRDVKPDNVLLSGDAAVVTDFGIAKALTAAATAPGAATVTESGTVIGTLAYMSPEQALGDPATDQRTDIYAFGCLAYELFAGSPPFTGTTAHQIISAKLAQRPKPLTELRADAPEALSHLIAHCLEQDPAARPASAAELLEVLGTMTHSRAPARSRRRSIRRPVALILVLIAMTFGAWSAARATRGGPVSIAVLPLEVTGDPAQDLAAGFTEDLTTALVRVPWLRVMSRGGASNYRGLTSIDPRTAADSLAVRYLLVGSLVQTGGGLSVILQLIRGKDGSLVWGEKFPQPQRLDVLLDQIVRTVGDSLRRDAGRFAARFGVDSTPPPHGATDDAYTLYLKGKQKLSERGPGIRESIRLFREAKALDPSSAKAWSGLSFALAASVLSQLASIDSIRPEAIASANHALRLDPALTEPHIALGLIHTLDRQWGRAETALRTAVERNPHDAEARIPYARLLISQGRVAEGVRQIEAAHASDPASSIVLTFKSFAHLIQGDLDSAVIWSNRAIKTNPSFLTRIFRGMVLIRSNRSQELRQLVQDLPPLEAWSLYLTAASGDSASVRAKLATLDDDANEFPAAWTARAFAFLGLGDTANALNALDSATARREIWHTITYLELPPFDAVRNSPRFRVLLQKVGLTPR